MLLHLDFSILPNSLKRLKIGILNISLGCTSKFFRIPLRVGKLGFFKFPCFHILSDCDACLSSTVCDGQGEQCSYLFNN